MQDYSGLLVPVDFSPAARTAFDHALSLASGDEPAIILLHVLDTALVDFAAVHELGAREEVIDVMRSRADKALAEYRAPAETGVEVMSMVVEGVPFFEIVKKADELHVDAIVMGKFGLRGKIEPYLFGTTAERVIRASTRPVIVLPAANA